MAINLLISLVAVSIAIGVWAAGSLLLRGPSRQEQVCSRIRDSGQGPTRGLEPLAQGLQVLPTFHSVPLMRPKTELDRRRLALEMARAGCNAPLSVELYLTSRVAAAVIGGILAFGGGLGLHGLSLRAAVLPALCIAGGFFLPQMVVRWRQRRRQEEFRRSLPDALDLLTIAIEVGHGIDYALQRVTGELREAAPKLAEELDRCNQEVQLGRARRDALHDLGLRGGIAEMTSFANAIIQGHSLGTGIAEALWDQSRRLRIMLRQRAEERAQQSALRLIFPLVLFIFPGIFLVLVGPAALLIMRDMLSLQ